MNYYFTIATSILITLTGMMSIYIITGLTGLFSMGQASFMCIGAYTTGLLALSFNTPLILNMVISVIAGMIFAGLVGLPIIKLRTDYFALITLGFGQAIVALLNNLANITGGARGLNGIPRKTTFVIALVVFLICLYVVVNFKNSKFGRQCLAIKSDPISAASMGIDVSKIKLTAFIVASGITALSGSLLAHFTSYVEPNSFGWNKSAEWIIMVFIGGINSLSGAIFSGAILSLLPEVLRFAEELRIVIYSVLVLLVINFLPQGLFGKYEINALINKIVSKLKHKSTSITSFKESIE